MITWESSELPSLADASFCFQINSMSPRCQISINTTNLSHVTKSFMDWISNQSSTLCIESLYYVWQLKASRPLIRVLVINDNGLWIIDFIWYNEYRLIHGWKRFGCDCVEFWRWWAKLGLKQRYKIGLLYFTGHKAFSGWKVTGFVG